MDWKMETLLNKARVATWKPRRCTQFGVVSAKKPSGPDRSQAADMLTKGLRQRCLRGWLRGAHIDMQVSLQCMVSESGGAGVLLKGCPCPGAHLVPVVLLSTSCDQHHLIHNNTPLTRLPFSQRASLQLDYLV